VVHAHQVQRAVDDRLADVLGVRRADHDVAQLSRAMGAGARQFIITGFVPDPRAFMRRWSREVIPALG